MSRARASRPPSAPALPARWWRRSPTPTATVSAGVARFSCSLNQAGSYTLSATSSPAHGTATSNTFNVVAGDPSSVAVSAGDGQSATVTTNFGTVLAAKVTDAGGNPVAG